MGYLLALLGGIYLLTKKDAAPATAPGVPDGPVPAQPPGTTGQTHQTPPGTTGQTGAKFPYPIGKPIEATDELGFYSITVPNVPGPKGETGGLDAQGVWHEIRGSFAGLRGLRGVEEISLHGRRGLGSALYLKSRH